MNLLIIKMEDHKQKNLPNYNPDVQNIPGVDNFPSIFKTSKQILSNDKISGKHFEGRYMVRGINTTGYSTYTVFDPALEGLHQIRTFIDVGNTTITLTSPGESGQEMYLKIDNDTDANRTITFGSYFKVTGTLTGSTAASAILHFISDGSYFWEVSRTTGLNQ